ncbi:MAG: YceI family protein [Bacteroidales bacterium]|nr:YceI family protein [Bacteroidales bacterium]
MKQNNYLFNSIFGLFAILFISNYSPSFAQNSKSSPIKPVISILGTSTLHDWESKVEQSTGEYLIDQKSIKSLTINIPVLSIKSKDEEKLMDKKTYEALNSSKNPTITFQLTEPATPVFSGSDAEVTLTGNLTIAGVTKKISIKSSGKKSSSDAFRFTGSVPIKMSDYKIKPPVAMLGLIKTGDLITVKFDVTISQQSLLANF